MRNLEVYGRQCIENLNAIGIYPNEVSEFKINTRAKKRWGQARKINGVYSININVLLLQDDCPERALLETLYHELLPIFKDQAYVNSPLPPSASALNTTLSPSWISDT